ncbi:MAG: RDD family protein, partial [Planctomycetes bacterium]|nr:RDD family protein [Planctomycetota bacterium]
RLAARKMFLAGDTTGLWLVVPDEKQRTFSIAYRPSGQQWRWNRHGLSGEVAAAVAVNEQLHVLFKSGGCHIYGFDVDFAGPKLPGLLLAACAIDRENGKSTSVLAVTRDAGPPSRRSGHAPPDAGAAVEPANLTLRYQAGDGWPVMAELEVVPLGPEDRLFVAAVGTRVHLLVCAASGEAKDLRTFADGQWTVTKLTGELARAKVLAMPVVDGRTVIVVETPTLAGRTLRLAFADNPSGALIEMEPRQVVPQEARGPLAATFSNKRLALFWWETETLRGISCDTDGGCFPLEEMSLLDHVPSNGQADVFLHYVLWILMLTIFAIMFLPGRNVSRGPMAIPIASRPADLSKRIVAGAIDMILACIVAAPIVPDLPRDLDGLTELMRQAPIPDQIIYANLIVLGSYTAYSIAMEWRYGATLGKMIFKLRVVAEGGRRPSVREILLRNLSRMILLTSGYLLPLLVLFPLLNPARQRLGDILARTAVLDARSVPPLGSSSHPDDTQPPGESTD